MRSPECKGQVHDYVTSRTDTLAFLLGLGGLGLVSMISVHEGQMQFRAGDNTIHELAKTWRNNAASHSRSVETGREIDLRSRKLLAFLDSHQGHLDSDLDRVSRDLGLATINHRRNTVWLHTIQTYRSSMRVRLRRLAGSRRKGEHDVQVGMNATFKASPSVRVISTEDGAALLDIKRGVCCRLDVVGHRIWQFIASSASGVTLGALLEHLAETFKIGQHEIQADIVECLLRLESQGLILRNRSGGGMRAP